MLYIPFSAVPCLAGLGDWQAMHCVASAVFCSRQTSQVQEPVAGMNILFRSVVLVVWLSEEEMEDMAHD